MANRVNSSLTAPTQQKTSQLPFIGTFHALGAKILREEGYLINRTSDYTIYDDSDSLRLMKQIIKELGLSKEKISASLALHHVSKVKNAISDLQDHETGHRDLDETFLDLYEAYEKKLLTNNAFDFDDLIEKPVRIFLEYGDVLKKYRERFRYILVDEFQDINTAQYEFIRLLGKESGNVSVVGDDAQSIYSFRGSDFRNFLNFEKDWQGAKVVLLEENYRSSANIITAASAVIANNKVQKPKKLWTQKDAGDPIAVIEHHDERGEAVWIAQTIRELLKKTKSNHEILPEANVAILYRTNAQSRPIEQALIEEHITYEIFGGIRFYDRKEIKDIVAGLRYAINPKDSASHERLKETFLKKQFLEIERDLPLKSESLKPVELIGYLLKTTDYLDYLKRNYPNAEERIENIAELITFAAEYVNTNEFLEKVMLLQGNDLLAGRRKKNLKTPVQLMTIHSSKGLEFTNVIVVGAAEGLLPHGMAYKNTKGEEAIEEERRLMYVAMTRAKEKLFLSFYGLGSRFLYEIPPELIEFKSFVSDQHNAQFSDDEERFITFD